MVRGAVSIEGVRCGKWSSTTSETRKTDHRFFTAMAFAMSIGIFGGFARTYFAKIYFHTPVLPLWLHLHGAVFTAWFLLYILQNVLAMYKGMTLHRRLGILGLMLSAGVVFFGLAIAVRQARDGRFFPFPDRYGSIAVTLGQMMLFAGLVGIGLLKRRDAETHKRLMLMSSQIFFFPAFGRLLHSLGPGLLLLALCFYLAGPVYDLISRGRIHSAYKWGVPLLILTMPPFPIIGSHIALWERVVDHFM